ncbi:MAG: Stp1/IreP family PP2C-type Ser/Thr phosphatase [Elusimicrobiota bacterium]|jgi:protein phosphatase
MNSGQWEFFGRTDTGCVRSNNEDNLLIDDAIGLLVVADGMGGHNSGEVASALAVSTIRDFARKLLAGDQVMDPASDGAGFSLSGRQLDYCVRCANTVIYDKGRAFPDDAGMGTTVVAALAGPDHVSVAHVGDSRLYIFRNGTLVQLTEDHSLVGDQLRRGLISSEEAARSNLQNILTRALGAEEDVRVDVADHPVRSGDIILMATDGLNKMVSDERIAQVIKTEASPKRIVEALVALARQAGGTDNITVICGCLTPRPAAGLLAKVRRLLKRSGGRRR